jgi:hypothetical protein
MLAAITCNTRRLCSVRVILQLGDSIWALVVAMPGCIRRNLRNSIMDGAISGEARAWWAVGSFWEFREWDTDSVSIVSLWTLAEIVRVTYLDAKRIKRLREAGDP